MFFGFGGKKRFAPFLILTTHVISRITKSILEKKARVYIF